MLFREAKVVILNKIDLIPYTNFNHSSFLADLNNINGKVQLLEISCSQNLGLDKWYQWITTQIVSK